MRQRAAIFVIDQNKLLLFHRVKKGREYYAVPGGGVEAGETVEQAAVRELKEETNLDVVLGEGIGEFETTDSHEYFYGAKSWSGMLALGGPEAQRQSPDNFYQLEWVPVENLGEINFRDEIRRMVLRYVSPASYFLDATVTVIIDRPLGSRHPEWGFEYPINYGYVPHTKSDDGEEVDAYVLGVAEPLKEFTGKCIAVIHRLNDDDDKLILVAGAAEFNDDEIRSATDFQERFFKSIIVR